MALIEVVAVDGGGGGESDPRTNKTHQVFFNVHLCFLYSSHMHSSPFYQNFVRELEIID
jgi:hypothetical protein